MATKDRKKLQHIHSSIADKQPTPQSLEVGEIAVNNAAGKEFISLKNSNDKVVRFSSDSTIIDWMEKKEVMPYSGVVDNVHLDTNRSNIEIKINQVAAKNTPKYDKINGAVDIDGQPVNPSTDGGKTDGAGISIDMSRYAMIGANPTFSSITVTHRSNLSGTTNISNGAGGTALNITTTDVTANDTNWTEAITTKKSTVTTEEDKIATLKESATTRTTVVGTENLTVSGTTTEVHTGNVTITNANNVIENTSGTTTIDRKGNVSENNQNNVTVVTSGTTSETKKGKVTETNLADKQESTSGNSYNDVKLAYSGTTGGTTTEVKVGNVTENNLANKQENTTGTHKVYTTGDTCVNSQANANFYGKVSTNIGVACDGAKGSETTVYGTTTTISGNTTSVTGATTLNLSGATINEKASTANTNVTSAYTSATTATTVIGTANTSATTATLSGNTLDITEATRLSAKTPSTYVSGTSLSVAETNTDITSCGRISANTNDFEVKQCAANGKFIVNSDDVDVSGKTFDVVETTSATIKAPATTISGATLTLDESANISAKTPTTTLSGTNLTINEANTVISSCTKIDLVTNELNLKQCTTGSVNFDFCGGFGVNSNNIKLHQCGSAGTISISAQTQNINGGNLTVNESGNTAINTTGTTNIKSAGNTNVETTGNNNKVTIQASGTGGDVEVFAKDTLCASGGTTAAMVGTTKTNIGKNCSDVGQTTTLNLNGNTINETGATVNISGSTSTNVSGATVNVSGGSICETAAATAAFVGATRTNIGSNCSGGGQTATLNLNGNAINESGTTVNISGTTTNISANTFNENVVGTTTINRSGATTEYNRTGYTANTTGDTCIQSTVDVNVGGAANTNIGTNCDDSVKANYVNIKAKSGITETANTVTISGTNTVNVSGATINESGTTHNENFTNYDVNAGNDYCVSAATRANFYGKATNIGIDCNGTKIATATTIEGTTVNLSGNTVNISGNTNGGVNIKSPINSDINIEGGDVTITGSQITIGSRLVESDIVLAPMECVHISGGCLTVDGNTYLKSDTYLSGNTYFHKTCAGLTNNEIDAAFCEVLSRGAVTIEKNTSPTDPQLATVYTVKQNGAVINTIEVAKDQFLQNAEVVKNTSGEWVIRLTWWIYDPDSGTHTTATTDIDASELVHDLTYVNPDDNGTALNHNVKVYSWYDSTSGDMKFSAETTQDMHVGNMYVTGTTSASTVSGTNVNGGTISGTTVKGVAISGTNITASDAIRANNVSANTLSAATGIRANNVSASTISATTFTGAMSKKLTWAAGTFTADTTGYDGSADKTITVPTSIKNLSNWNGSCYEFDAPLCVTGTITASQAIYSSDRNLKNNIKDVEYKMVDDAHNVRIKQFNFKSEPENLIVGVIAQEVEEHNLGDFVYTKEDGNKAVDYTSLMMLKIKYLENENEYLKAQMAEIRLRMESLENKINNQ